MALTDKLTAIANAIREKTGKTESLTLDEMAEEIAGIPGDDVYLGKLLNKQMTELVSSTASGYIPPNFQQNNNLLTRIDLPLVTKLGTSSFSGCGFLTEINLPNVVEIESSAFNICHRISEIYFPNLEKLTGWGYTFSNNKFSRAYLPKLTELTSPLGFAQNPNLTTFIIGSSTVCSLSNSNTFNETPIAKGTGYFYVHRSVVDRYKVATNWSVYASQFRAIEDYPEVLEGWE